MTTSAFPRVAWDRFQALLTAEGYTQSATLPGGTCGSCGKPGATIQVWDKGTPAIAATARRRRFVVCSSCHGWEEERG